jgi:uncharacterized membrane protein YciS (DUF1049 family)
MHDHHFFITFGSGLIIGAGVTAWFYRRIAVRLLALNDALKRAAENIKNGGL